MIVYPLACDSGHEFEGWFASAEACEQQAGAGRIQCPSCSSAEVHKLPSAPHIRTSGGEAAPAKGAANTRLQAVVALRKYILANTEDVGRKFPEVARRMHYEEEEARNVRGVVTQEEARDLREEGIETLTLSSEVIPPEELH